MNRYTKVGTSALLRTLHGFAHMSPLQTAIAAILFAIPGRIYSVTELTGILYGERDDGGPDNPANVIAASVYYMRRKGFPIATHGWRGYSYEPSERHGHE